MSQDIGILESAVRGFSVLESALVAGVGVDDADVEVGDQQDDGGAVVGAADADVVHAAGAAE